MQRESIERQVFRARPNYWFVSIALPALLIMMGVLMAYIGLRWFAGAALVMLLAGMWYIWPDSFPVLFSRVTIDAQGIATRGGGERHRVEWNAVIAADVADDVQQTLQLLTPQGLARIPLAPFDAQAIWDEVVLHVPDDALHPEAYTDDPIYEHWEDALAPDGSPDSRPLTVADPLVLTAFGWGSIVFFGAAMVLAWYDGQPLIGRWFAPLILLGFFLLVYAGRTSINGYYVMREKTFGLVKFQIPWEEVERVEMGGDQQTVFFGAGKRLSIPAPQSGRGADQRAFMQLLNRQIETREIPVEPTGRALFLASRNTRVQVMPEFQENPNAQVENA